ncbi:MAG: polyprenyl synthetase family protein [Candidatus Heimdallarchaeaceae archaeon]
MNFKGFYTKKMEQVNIALTQFINEEIAACKDNPFLEYYVQEVNNFLFSGGKRIRPVLMLLSYEACLNTDFNESIYPASLSIELLHNASLIHDDIMDFAETRRGKKAFHVVLRDYSKQNYPKKNVQPEDYGLAMGILGGDFVYNLAYKALNRVDFKPDIMIKAASEFNKGFMEVVKGVIYETDMQGRFEVTEKQYFEMINGKTAALFEKATKMGAIYAEAEETQLKALSSYARNMGIAFQIVDDIIGTFGDEMKTGKPVDSDIKEGKKTILLIKTIENANDKEKDKLKQVIGKRNATKEEIEEIKDIMRETGALDYAKAKAEELFSTCKLFIEKAEPAFEKKYKEYLIEIAKMGVNRSK